MTTPYPLYSPLRSNLPFEVCHYINGRRVVRAGRVTIDGVKYEVHAITKWGRRYWTHDYGDHFAASVREAIAMAYEHITPTN